MQISGQGREMMQLNENDVCKALKAVAYYRDNVTGSDFMWDEYDNLLRKMGYYGEEVTEKERLVCNN